MKPTREQGRNDLLVLRADYENRLNRDFPALYRDEFCLVDNRSMRIVIDDISYQTDVSLEESLEFLFIACSGDIQSFDARRQAQMLAQKMERLKTVLDPRKTMVLFPGNGAQTVKDLLPEDFFADMEVICVPTTRTVDPKTKAVQGVAISEVTQMRKMVSDKRITNFVVVDDVIMSGTTLTALREALPGRNATWYAGGLFMLSPIQNKGRAKTPSGVDGYMSIVAPTVYQGTNGIPAMNSLSTLVGESEKSNMVRERYMTDFVSDPEIFIEMVKQIQESVKLQS